LLLEQQLGINDSWLAPNANPARFTDEAKADKWFKRNCNDVLDRDCTAQKKAEVLSWLMTVK